MKYVYKAVAALGSLSIVGLLYYLPLFFYKLQSTALQLLITAGSNKGIEAAQDALEQNGGVASDTIADSASISSLITDFGGFFQGSGSTADKLMDLIRVPLIVAVIAFALIIVAAVVTAVMAIVVKDNRKVIYSALSGIGMCIVFKYAFSGLTAPFVDGTYSLAQIFDAWWVALIAQVQDISLTTSFYLIPIAFLFIIVWTALYNLTLPADEKNKLRALRGELPESYSDIKGAEKA